MRAPVLVRSLVVLAAPAAFAQQAVLEGIVQDSVTGQPIEGVEITHRSRLAGPTKSDALGRFRFDHLPSGRHSLLAKKLGYAGSDYGETFPAHTGREHKLSLIATATLEGTLLGEDDQPLAGATVYAENITAETNPEAASGSNIFVRPPTNSASSSPRRSRANISASTKNPATALVAHLR
jgi:hypothetical protein